MEPDIDKILSNRIRQVELRPVAWNKEPVWQNLQAKTHPKRRYLFYYYAAAAIISLLFYVVVERIPNEKKPQVADAKATPRQEETQSESTVTSERSKDQPTAPVASGLDFADTAPQKKLFTNSTDTPASPKLEIQNLDVIAEPVLPDIQLPEELFLIREEVEIPAQRIRPVVGVITGSHSENITKVKRKKRLHKLEPSPTVPWDDPGNALVFTVRK